MTNLRYLVKKALFKAGLYRINKLRNRFHILAYHMVVEKPNGFYPQTSLFLFEKHMEHLARNYRVVSLHEIVKRLEMRKSLRGLAVITFDDGYMDNYLNAYPILKRLGLPATIFLTTGYLDSGATPWFIRFRQMFMATRKEQFEFRLGTELLDLPMNTPSERLRISDVTMAYLKVCPDRERSDLIGKLSIYLQTNDSSNLWGLMLGWDNVREMAKNGITFGSHTVNHPVLARLPIEQAAMEIRESKARIEAMTGNPVRAFAYPFGKKDDYSPEIFSVLAKLNFDCAVTTENLKNSYSRDRYELGRSEPVEFRLL